MQTNKRKQQINTKKMIIILIIIVLVLFAAFLGLRYLKNRINERFTSKDGEAAESAQVTSGSISTTVYGKGTLSNEESDTLTLPSTVEVTEIFVSAGGDVEKGDLIASVNASTVLEAMADKQAEIDELDEKIADIAEDTVSEKVTAPVTGRVKQIFASNGDDVTEVMINNNALMTISLDGYMAVDIENGTLARKDSVTVTTEAGKSYKGTVSSVAGGTATVLITDNGPEYGAAVTVTDSEGNEVGKGTLYINEPVSVTGFAGTVSYINVSLNTKVSSGTTLMKLTDVSYSANYATLLSQREDLENDLMDLLTVYREGGVYAHSAGTVTAVTKGTYTTAKSASGGSASSSSSAFSFGGAMTGGTSSAAESSDTEISICPNDTMQVTISVDETDILSLTAGQEASVYISSLGDDAYTGTVSEIGTTGTSSNGVTSYSAVIRVTKEKGMLNGMSATAYVTIEGTDNALLIPADALNETSTTAYVYTEYDEETDTLGGLVEVETGLKNSRYVEIKTGLAEGDTVYYKPSEKNSSGFSFGGFGGGSMPGFSGGGSSMPGGFSGGGSMPGGFSGGGDSRPSGGGFSGFPGGGSMPSGFGGN